MKAESELQKHYFWHALFTRKMGMYSAQAYNEENDQVCRITRVVQYCTLCKVDFHEGEAIKTSGGRLSTFLPSLNLSPSQIMFFLLTRCRNSTKYTLKSLLRQSLNRWCSIHNLVVVKVNIKRATKQYTQEVIESISIE